MPSRAYIPNDTRHRDRLLRHPPSDYVVHQVCSISSNPQYQLRRAHIDYAYAVEFVEVDPIFELNTEIVHLPNAQDDARLQQDLRVDRERYHGLHGNAILSRYPMRTRVFSGFRFAMTGTRSK